MPDRRFKPRERTSAVRDARLIIIAAEGSATETRYFEDMARQYRNPKVHVNVLPHETEASAPEHIIRLLDNFRRQYSLTQSDELWLVIDLDRWGSGKIGDIAAQCHQKQYRLAVSNPCFEVWLLLHLTDLTGYSAKQINTLMQNRRDGGRRTPLESELVRLCGEHNKSNLNTERYLPAVKDAISRAQALDTDATHRWPNGFGTRVYLLAMSILRK